MNKIATSLIALSVISVIFISGCTTPTPSGGGTSAAVCGNSVVEQGEQCDNSACGASQYCSTGCQCVAKPAPPALPS